MQPIIKRLFAETVAYQMQCTARPVAKGEGELSLDPLQRPPHPVTADQLKQDLGIRAVLQLHPVAVQFRSQRSIAE